MCHYTHFSTEGQELSRVLKAKVGRCPRNKSNYLTLFETLIYLFSQQCSTCIGNLSLIHHVSNYDIVNIPLHIFLKKFEMFCIGINPHGA